MYIQLCYYYILATVTSGFQGNSCCLPLVLCSNTQDYMAATILQPPYLLLFNYLALVAHRIRKHRGQYK